jgi:murein DD-endopeptidase MepM/ murein hydrolase activator NlpD
MRVIRHFWVGVLVVSALATSVGAEKMGLDGYTNPAAVEGAIAENLARIEHAQSRQAQIDSEVAGLAAQQEEAKGRLHDRARALYRVRRAGMLPVAGGFQALMQHLARVQRLSRMVKSDLDMVSFLQERGQALDLERKELDKALREAHLALRGLEDRKEELERKQRRASAYALRSDSRDGAVDELSHGQFRVSSGDEGDLDTGFAEMRGELAFPVQGSQRVQDAERDGAPGLEFAGRPGASIRAAADGRVAFVREYGAYGQMIILDHGHSFYTVYGGVGRVEVAVGDWVGMSARIGSLTEKPLFFEVRRGTRSLDPRSWLGL